MKRKITFFMAALCAVMLITQPNKVFGQTRTDEVYKTLTFCTAGNNSNKVQDYTSSWTESISNFGWTISNFNNNNWGWTDGGNPALYIVKCGRKKGKTENTPSVATITTNGAIDQTITKVVVTLTAINSSDYNNIKLYMASTDAFDEENDDYFETITVSSIPTSAGDMTIDVPEAKRAANRYYKIAFDTKGSTTSNGHTGVKKVEYYKAGSPSCSVSETPDGNFGDVQVGQTASKTYTVTTANLTGALTLSAGDGVFSVTSPSPATIAQNATTTQVTVTFTPSAVTTYNGSLTISGGGLANNVTVSLTGSGTCTPPTNDLTYTTPVNLTLENGEAEYSLAPTPGTGNGGSITYEVTTNPEDGGSIDGNTFTATKTGTYVITATQALNGTTCGGTATITIIVNGTAPVCTIDEDMYDFENVGVNLSKSQVFTITTANLTEDIELSMSDAKYSVDPATIDKDAVTTDITITFSPTATGLVEAELLVNGSGFEDELLAMVSGTGAPTYTVTFNKGNGTCATETVTNIEGYEFNLPAATPSELCADADWVFAGWATSSITETTTAPNPLYATNSSYSIPENGTTLYAVYSVSESGNKDSDVVFSNGSYSSTDGTITWTESYITILQEQGTSTTPVNNSYISAPRWYKNHVITLTPSSSINTIVIEQDSGNAGLTDSGTTYTNATKSANGTTVTITPTNTSNAVTITLGAQSRPTKITVNHPYNSSTYATEPDCREQVATPTISLQSGTYGGTQTVTLSCETENSTIYYTLDGNDPTTSSAHGTSVSVTASCTLKAMAVAEGYKNSEIASAEYTIETPYTTIASLFAAATENAQSVYVTFGNWVVSGKTTYNVYVTDGTNGLVINANNHGFEANDIISGTVIPCTLQLYNGYARLTNITASTTGLTITKNGTVSVANIAMADLSGVNTGALVSYQNLSCTKQNSYYILSDGTTQIQAYNALYGDMTFSAGHNYNITGVYQQYGETKDILPRSAADIVEVEYDITLTQPTGGTIGAQDDEQASITTAKYGQEVTLTSTPADHYRFSSWTVMNGQTPVSVTNNKFTMPKAPVTVTATFVQLYDITIATGIEHGTVALTNPSATPAAEGDNVALTVTPDDGYALKALTVYKTGDQSTTVSVSNNAFTMPAYAVTVTAEFDAEYTVKYYPNFVGTTEDPAEHKYGAGANVEILDNMFTAPEGQLFVEWNTVAGGTGDKYQAGATINNIQNNVDLYAQWRNIVYHITYNVNGDTSETEDVDYGESTTYQPELSPLTFIGWKLGDDMVGKTYTPTGTTEDITLVAVFGSTSDGQLTIEPSDVPGSYSSNYGNVTVSTTNDFSMKNIMNQQTTIQFKGDAGGIYNNNSFGKIESIVITYTSGSPSKNITVKPNLSASSSSSNDAITPSVTNTYTYTFTFSGNYGFFLMENGSGANNLSSIVIYYETASPVTVNIINTDTDMDDDIPANTSVVVESGVTLTFTGENKGTAENLIIEDGGQLIVPDNATVAATIKKNTVASKPETKDAAVNKWYAVASPVASLAIADFVQGTHNVYRYVESTNYWNEYRNTSTENGCDKFDNFENGRGYLYRSTEANVEYAGTVNAANVNYTLSYANSNDAFKGFNLIGNPFTHDIYKGAAGSAIPNGDLLEAKYYVLQPNGEWTLTDDGTAIPSGTATLVQANKSGTLTISNSTEGYVASAKDRAGNDNIWFTVKNNEFIDKACVEFKEGRGLNKMAHYNENAPMLYVKHNGENFASVDMLDDTKTINLCFKATEFGYNTMSLKANGNFSYLHLIDRLTGEDVDMLLEGEYSFMASPTDNPERFIVKLEYSEGSESSEVFAYQNGSDIIVSGEGELQVFDVTGRMVKIQRINGVQTINLNTQGVYIFKLNDKVQKVVVR